MITYTIFQFGLKFGAFPPRIWLSSVTLSYERYPVAHFFLPVNYVTAVESFQVFHRAVSSEVRLRAHSGKVRVTRLNDLLHHVHLCAVVVRWYRLTAELVEGHVDNRALACCNVDVGYELVDVAVLRVMSNNLVGYVVDFEAAVDGVEQELTHCVEQGSFAGANAAKQ